MKHLKILPFILLAVSAISCGGDDEQTFVMPQQTFLVSKNTVIVKSSSEVYSSSDYAYDGANQLTSELTLFDSKTYSRNTSGKIYKITTLDSGSTIETVFTYQPDGKLASETLSYNGTTSERREYSYFSNRYEEKVFNSNNENVIRYEYYYTADGKNIGEIKQFSGNGDAYTRTTIEYDNRMGVNTLAPFSQLPEPFYNANNAVIRITRNPDEAIIETRETQFTFNELGYPVKADDGTFIRNLEYIAK